MNSALVDDTILQLIFYLVAMASFQENDNTPLEHTPSNPPLPIMKGIPAYILLVKVAWGVFQFGVLKQP